MADLEHKIWELYKEGKITEEELGEFLKKSRRTKGHGIRNFFLALLCIVTIGGAYLGYRHYEQEKARQKAWQEAQYQAELERQETERAEKARQLELEELLNPNVEKELVIKVESGGKYKGELISRMATHLPTEIINSFIRKVYEGKYERMPIKKIAEDMELIRFGWVSETIEYPSKERWEYEKGDITLVRSGNHLFIDCFDIINSNRYYCYVPPLSHLPWSEREKIDDLIQEGDRITLLVRKVKEKQLPSTELSYEHEQPEPTEPDKYTGTSYYNMGEPVVAGDLEVFINSYRIEPKQEYNEYTGSYYNNWFLYLNLTLHNSLDQVMPFRPEWIRLAVNGHEQSMCEPTYEYELGQDDGTLMVIHPRATINRTYPFLVTNCGGMYARVIVPKLKIGPGSDYDIRGTTYINLFELPEKVNLGER